MLFTMMRTSWDWALFADALVLFILGAAAQSVCTAWRLKAGSCSTQAKMSRREKRENGIKESPRGRECDSHQLQRHRQQQHQQQIFDSDEQCMQLQPAQRGKTSADRGGRPSACLERKWTTYEAYVVPFLPKACRFPKQNTRTTRGKDDRSSSAGPRVMRKSSPSFERTLINSSDVKLGRAHSGSTSLVETHRLLRGDSTTSIDASLSSSSTLLDCERASGAPKRMEAKPAASSSGSRFYADVVSRAQQANREHKMVRQRSMSFP